MVDFSAKEKHRNKVNKLVEERKRKNGEGRQSSTNIFGTNTSKIRVH